MDVRRASPPIGRRAAVVALAGWAAACHVDGEPADLPAPDPVTFRERVYPILLAECGFGACHGDADRFFRVVGPGRTRLDPATAPYAPVTAEELALTYSRASSMLVDEDGVLHAPLLRKPLAVAAGGASHAGRDAWGADPFLSAQDPRFVTLRACALTAEAAP